MNVDKLRGKLVEKKKTYEECSKYLGISITSFSNKMNSRTNFYVDEINKLSELLELTNQEKIDIFLN